MFFPILSVFMLTFSSGQLQGITRDPPQLSHNSSPEVFGGPAPNQSTDMPQNNLHICYRAEDINTSMVMPVLCIASTAELVLSSLQYVGFFFSFSHACCNPGNRQHPHRRLTRTALFPSGTKKGCKHFTTLKANETTQI